MSVLQTGATPLGKVRSRDLRQLPVKLDTAYLWRTLTP